MKYVALDKVLIFFFSPIKCTLPAPVSAFLCPHLHRLLLQHELSGSYTSKRSSNISLYSNYHSSSFFTSSSALLFSFIHLSLAHTFTNPIRDSLIPKPRSCDILELLNTLFSFPSLKCRLNPGFFRSSLLKYGSNYSYYILKPLRRPLFPP
jgi:hypothetical protein